jgi:hypothetical protein
MIPRVGPAPNPYSTRMAPYFRNEKEWREKTMRFSSTPTRRVAGSIHRPSHSAAASAHSTHGHSSSFSGSPSSLAPAVEIQGRRGENWQFAQASSLLSSSCPRARESEASPPSLIAKHLNAMVRKRSGVTETSSAQLRSRVATRRACHDERRTAPSGLLDRKILRAEVPSLWNATWTCAAWASECVTNWDFGNVSPFRICMAGRFRIRSSPTFVM